MSEPLSHLDDFYVAGNEDGSIQLHHIGCFWPVAEWDSAEEATLAVLVVAASEHRHV